jgi:predicted RNA-binding Zn-ribbon protein involved in translation (DUF1610 family)
VKTEDVNHQSGDWYFQIVCRKCGNHVGHGDNSEDSPVDFLCKSCGEVTKIMAYNCQRVRVQRTEVQS